MTSHQAITRIVEQAKQRTSAGTWLVVVALSSILASCASESPADNPDAGQADAGQPDAGQPDGGDPAPTDRGIFSGSLANAGELRDAFDETDPIEPVIVNFAAAPGSQRIEADLDDLQPDQVKPLEITLPITVGTGRTPWNGLAGTRLASDFVQSDYTSNWPLPNVDACVPPEERISCCTYVLTEGEDGSGNTVEYYSPKDMFAECIGGPARGLRPGAPVSSLHEPGREAVAWLDLQRRRSPRARVIRLRQSHR